MKINRINKIEAMLEKSETLSINQLCESFQVSKNTIRRDIAELEKRGYIQKVYGGIMRSQRDTPEPFASREIKNQAKKKQIAQIASRLVSDNDVIYIDSGTTTMHMIPFLANRKNLTIITTSVHVVNAAFPYPQLNVIATGGSLHRPSNAFVGSSVIRCLSNYNISKTFLASTGFSIEVGATNASPLECEIKRFLADKSNTKILLVDSSKVGKTSLMTFCQLGELNIFVMDQEPPKEYLDYFNAHGIELMTK